MYYFLRYGLLNILQEFELSEFELFEFELSCKPFKKKTIKYTINKISKVEKVYQI